MVRARTKPVGPVTPYDPVAAGAQRSTGSAWAEARRHWSAVASVMPSVRPVSNAAAS